MKNTKFFAPPCGVNCKKCPRYKKGRNECEGYEAGCKARKCKSIYICCKEKKGHNFCYECSSYPCARFKKFAESWHRLGEDLYLNQNFIREKGIQKFVECDK